LRVAGLVQRVIEGDHRRPRERDPDPGAVVGGVGADLAPAGEEERALGGAVGRALADADDGSERGARVVGRGVGREVAPGPDRRLRRPQGRLVIVRSGGGRRRRARRGCRGGRGLDDLRRRAAAATGQGRREQRGGADRERALSRVGAGRDAGEASRLSRS
jgi:hypothetical protein